jgi:hypothetical protein
VTRAASAAALIAAIAGAAVEDQCLDCGLGDCTACADIEGLGCCCGGIQPDDTIDEETQWPSP